MNQLKEFVVEYFKVNNAKVLEGKKQLTIQIPKRLCEKLGCEQVLNITFDKKVAEKNPDIDFIAMGSALLNKILESCEKRGLTVVKQYKGSKFKGLEFNFRVAFESVDKKEKLISYLIDLKDISFKDNLLNSLSKKDYEEIGETSFNSEIVENAYNKCLDRLKKDVRVDMTKINQKFRESLEKEKAIIEKFYDGIITDLRKKQDDKIKAWKEKKQKAHSSQYVEIREQNRKELGKYEDKIMEIQEKNFEQLNNYFQIKQRRLKELENQYMLKTNILLYGTALVIVE
jgi:hypothetical protein